VNRMEIRVKSRIFMLWMTDAAAGANECPRQREIGAKNGIQTKIETPDGSTRKHETNLESPHMVVAERGQKKRENEQERKLR